MAEVKFSHSTALLEEKRAEGAELHAICDELIGKVGSGGGGGGGIPSGGCGIVTPSGGCGIVTPSGGRKNSQKSLEEKSNESASAATAPAPKMDRSKKKQPRGKT